jgi:hypothetical protein
MATMESRITHSATSFGDSNRSAQAQAAAGNPVFERPSALEISLCCEISAYAPDGDDTPLF